MKNLSFLILLVLLMSCGNSNSGKNDVLIDGGHGIGIDTTTVNEIKYYEDSIRTNESAKESTTSVAPSSSREEYHKHDNMRGFDPASEDDMDDRCGHPLNESFKILYANIYESSASLLTHQNYLNVNNTIAKVVL